VYFVTKVSLHFWNLRKKADFFIPESTIFVFFDILIIYCKMKMCKYFRIVSSRVKSQNLHTQRKILAATLTNKTVPLNSRPFFYELIMHEYMFISLFLIMSCVIPDWAQAIDKLYTVYILYSNRLRCDHRYLMIRLSLQVFYLWRHVLSTALPFILWWSNLEILFALLHRSSPMKGELRCQAIQTEHGPYIAERTQKAVYIVRCLWRWHAYSDIDLDATPKMNTSHSPAIRWYRIAYVRKQRCI
jgi:hypothetical protein